MAKDTSTTLPQHVTIVGAGTQGSMLAFRSALYGRVVWVYDRSDSALETAEKKINVWLAERVKRNILTNRDVTCIQDHLHFTSNIDEALEGTELIIENVPELLALKQSVWEEIDALAPPQALLTTNSSSLKSSDIGEHTKRKNQTFNVNFMTPTEDDLVEVMWNRDTSEDTKAKALAFLKAQQNIPIITQKEIKGFSLNRVWRMMKKECLKLWAGGYISPEDFDRAFMMEWNTDYGPFGQMDKVGLDIVYQIELTYYDESKDPSDLPPKALEEMVKQGLLGEKSGKGFYTYPNPAYLRKGWLRKEKD
ncbi:MAG: 3-hydroxyacyl-CoA dehydrogenase family protein [Firmicutes bacterium]|nr:3-hydroxyacyl-CoA dehydrogenase family protein [Bacillota bacterium]